jgi:hypothetical protein
MMKMKNGMGFFGVLTWHQPIWQGNLSGMSGYTVWSVFHLPTHPSSPGKQGKWVVQCDQVEESSSHPLLPPLPQKRRQRCKARRQKVSCMVLREKNDKIHLQHSDNKKFKDSVIKVFEISNKV